MENKILTPIEAYNRVIEIQEEFNKKLKVNIKIKYCVICKKPIEDSGIMCPHCGEFNPCCGYLPDEYGA